MTNPMLTPKLDDAPLAGDDTIVALAEGEEVEPLGLPVADPVAEEEPVGVTLALVPDTLVADGEPEGAAVAGAAVPLGMVMVTLALAQRAWAKTSVSGTERRLGSVEQEVGGRKGERGGFAWTTYFGDRRGCTPFGSRAAAS